MTSFFFKHSINSLRCFSSGSSFAGRRAIHNTSVVHKKASKVEVDDLFGDETAAEDLFSESIVEAQKEETETPKAKAKAKAKAKGSSESTEQAGAQRLSKRASLLNKQIAFMKPRLGASPLKTQPKIRPRSWFAMMHLAKDGEDMKKILDLLALSHHGGGTVPDIFGEEFVRRCEKLKCQRLALELFGNFAKYNIMLTPMAGRWLIHSIYVLCPLEDLIIAASLFPIYNLSLTDDLVSASMVAAACFKHDTPQSKAVANFLLPEIRGMLETKKNLVMPENEVERKRHLTWADWALKKINKFERRDTGKPFVPLPAVQVPASAVQL